MAGSLDICRPEIDNRRLKSKLFNIQALKLTWL